MSNFADDIRRIAKTPQLKDPLSIAQVRSSILGSTKAMTGLQKEDTSGVMAPPLTLEILTYDDTQDVEVSTPTGTATIKTAETAQIIDANGTIWAIDTIIYAAAV